MARGRPRTFDKERALDAALAVFWRRGYQGASLTELTRVMGISKPSLYAAFGNKERLYLAALQRYRERRLAVHADVLAVEPDLKKALRGFLRSVATMLTEPGLPGGCMVVNSAASCDRTTLPSRVIDAIDESIQVSSLGLLKGRLEEGLRRRKLPEGTPVGELADYLAAFMSGMAVLAKTGVSADRLFAMIEHALRALPDPDPNTESVEG